MISRSFKIPFGFFVAGIIWAACNDPLISLLCEKLPPATTDIIRSTNDFISVLIVSLLLYLMIKRQNKRLELSEKQYRQLFEMNPNPMWIYNKRSLRFVKSNKAGVALYGYSEEEFLSMTIMDIRPVEDHEKVLEYLKSLTGDVNEAGTWRHIKKNGEELYVSILTYDMQFNGAACGIVIATDITDTILKERKIREQNALLYDIAWSNSHEVRRSLCSVISLVDLLKDASSEQERNEYIALLGQCSNDFDELIKKYNLKIGATQDLSPYESL